MAMSMELLYDLASDHQRVAMATNIRPDPAAFGAEQWWDALGTNRLPLHHVEGEITQVYWSGMGDWPEFELGADDGSKTTWFRAGDVSRYVEGLLASVDFVMLGLATIPRVPGLTALRLPDLHPEIVRVYVERSDLRSGPRPPGPGGAGWRKS